ncbi:MAG: sigma-70 family RNA polymerase sigma factor [Opitutaceae bacterium]
MIEDAELLRRYAEEKSEEAFAELVQRRIGLVYSVAWRHTGDAYRAEDVTQAVFTALAKKARELSRRPVLVGWLYRSAQFAASDAVRAERRRQVREQEAHTMQQITREGAEPDWEKLQPVLDEVLNDLPDADRDAVLLRFFDGQPFAEIGRKLQLTENAARMRVERALDKLHALLARRGVTSTTAALGLTLANQASAAAPVGLVATVVSGALAIATGAGGTLAGAGAILTMSKIKTGLVGAVIVAVLATGFGELKANRALSAELTGLRSASLVPAQLQKESRQLNTVLAKLTADIPEGEELARLRRRIAQLKVRPPGVTDADMKPLAEWTNRGWATPEAALETIWWAGSIRNYEELVTNRPFVGSAKAKADAAFATLPEVVRLKYGTADRLLGAVGSGSRGAADDDANERAYGKVVAYQLLDTSIDVNLGGVSVRWWERLENGEEREMKHTFVRDGDRFTFGSNQFSTGMWDWIVSQLDLTTGELLPRKYGQSGQERR